MLRRIEPTRTKITDEEGLIKGNPRPKEHGPDAAEGQREEVVIRHHIKNFREEQ